MKIIVLLSLILCTAALFGQATDSYIRAYSGAERMKYNCALKPNVRDTLAQYYFLNHFYGNNSIIDGWEWEVPQADTHNDVVVISGNEYPYTWRAGNSAPMRLAACLQVARINTDDTDAVIELYAIQTHCAANGECARDTVIYAIPWNAFPEANTEKIFFSDGFHFKNSFRLSEDSLFIEAHCRRYVTVRMKWIAIEDSLAHDLLAGLDLDRHDPALRDMANETYRDIAGEAYRRPDIENDSRVSNNTLSYIVEHCPCSEWCSYGRVSALIRYAMEHYQPFVVTKLEMLENVLPSAVISRTPLR